MPEVPPFSVNHGREGRPSCKSVATMNRERQTEEEANPEKRQKRIEDEKRMKFGITIRVLILLCMCPRLTVMCPHTTIFVSSYYPTNFHFQCVAFS